MERDYGYTIATNCFVNVLSEKDGGLPNNSPAYVEVLPELWPITLPREYLTFTCLTKEYTGMVMLLNCRNGKLYARLISKWRFRDRDNYDYRKALPKLNRLMQNLHDVKLLELPHSCSCYHSEGNGNRTHLNSFLSLFSCSQTIVLFLESKKPIINCVLTIIAKRPARSAIFRSENARNVTRPSLQTEVILS